MEDCGSCKQAFFLTHHFQTILNTFNQLHSLDSLLTQQTCYSEGGVMLNANV